MLTQREILNQLRKFGIREKSLLKKYLEDFEHYWEVNYGLGIASEGGIAENTIQNKMCFNLKESTLNYQRGREG